MELAWCKLQARVMLNFNHIATHQDLNHDPSYCKRQVTFQQLFNQQKFKKLLAIIKVELSCFCKVLNLGKHLSANDKPIYLDGEKWTITITFFLQMLSIKTMFLPPHKIPLNYQSNKEFIQATNFCVPITQYLIN